VKGQKISKSLPATKVDPNAIADELGMDPLRYFVLREYTFGNDGDFTYETLFQRYESDLGNDLGNLLNRTVSLARQLPGGLNLPAFAGTAAGPSPRGEDDLTLETSARTAVDDTVAAWEDFAPSRALEATWGMIRRGNAYIDRTAPWKLGKAGAWDDLRCVLSQTCEIIRRAALMVAPAMPTAAREILRQIGREADVGTWPPAIWTGWPGGQLADPKPVFPRFDPDRQQALIAQWSGAVAEPAAPASAPAAAKPAANATATVSETATAEISIDDFAKIDLRAAKVLSAEKVPKTEKLLKLTLDLGSEQRTVISGIAGAYTPEQMVGRTVIYLANLKPAKIRGVISQGMILAAGAETVVAMSALDVDVAPGTKIR